MTDLTYPYSSRPFVMIGVILLGVVCTAVFVYMAAYDDNLELRFLGLYAVGWEAKALAWFFALFMAGLAGFGVYGLLGIFRQPKSASLTATALIAPKAPISKKIITVPYADITKLQKEEVMGQVFLHVYHPGGKLSISRSYLADKSAFDTIHRELQIRWDAATGVNVS